MENFTFFGNTVCDPRRYEFMVQERRLYQELRENVQKGLSLTGLFNLYSKELDFIFVTIFCFGRYHSNGLASSDRGNQKQNKVLAEAIFRLGYGFLQVDGLYRDVTEESYCVLNYKEDTKGAVGFISYIAHKLGQDSILVVPKGEAAYLNNFDGSRVEIGTEPPVIMKNVKLYTSVKFPTFKFSVVNNGCTGDSLHPVRDGKETMITVGTRYGLLKEMGSAPSSSYLKGGYYFSI